VVAEKGLEGAAAGADPVDGASGGAGASWATLGNQEIRIKSSKHEGHRCDLWNQLRRGAIRKTDIACNIPSLSAGANIHLRYPL